MDTFKEVLIVAGTHGNELSGIYIHKLIEDQLYTSDRSTFSAPSIIANPNAIKHNTRYVSTDLNREFCTTDNRTYSDSSETVLARQFIQDYAHKDNQLIVDLHNTTSNMGATLILLANDPFYQKMGAYVKQHMPEANILFEDTKPWSKQPYLCTSGKYGVMIEVGEQAHGALKYDTLNLMKQMLTAVLDYVEKHNLSQLPSLNHYHAFFYTEDVQIPLDNNGLREAMVHPAVCGKDFEVIKHGEPLLITLSGNDICWQEAHDVYPHFINESAYCKANIAMALAERRLVSVG